MEIRLARTGDIGGWMALVERVRDGFPGLETRAALEAHRETALGFMRRGEAVCAVEDGRVVGALLFSGEDNELCFLAVEPAFRRRHTAEKLVSRALSRMDPKRTVTVTTYREGDPAVAAAR